jgi:hypothetical protein
VSYLTKLAKHPVTIYVNHKNKYIMNTTVKNALLMAFLAMNLKALAMGDEGFNFDEYSLGLNASSFNQSYIHSVTHSRSFSDRFFYTVDLMQKSSDTSAQFSATTVETGFGVFSAISDHTDVYVGVSYSHTLGYGLDGIEFGALHLQAGAKSEVNDNLQLITETSMNKTLKTSRHIPFGQRLSKIDVDVASQFYLKNNTFKLGLSSTKGFPYLSINLWE